MPNRGKSSAGDASPFFPPRDEDSLVPVRAAGSAGDRDTSQQLDPMDLQAADQALRELGLCQLTLATVRAALKAKIRLAKEEARADSTTYRSRTAELQAALERYWLAPGSGSKPGTRCALTFGSLGWRTLRVVRLLPGWTIAQVIDAFSREFAQFLRVTPSIDWEAVLAVSPDQFQTLKQCGLAVEDRQCFFAEPDMEKICGVAPAADGDSYWANPATQSDKK